MTIPYATVLLNPADAHIAGGFTYTPFGGGWFDFVLPGDYVSGSDITVELEAFLFNLPDPGGLTPEPDSCFIWGWGAQLDGGAITNPSGTYLGGPPTLVPGSECVPFVRLPGGGHSDEPEQHFLTAVNTPETIQFIVPGTNEDSFSNPGYCGWIVGDAGSPPIGPLSPGTSGQGVTYPDNAGMSLANSFFTGTPSSANNSYFGSSTIGSYQVAAGSKTLGPGDTISILMQFFSWGGAGPVLQAGTGSITVITSGARETDVPLTDVRVGFLSGNSGIATTHGTITGEYAVDFEYPDVTVHSPWVPLYDGAYSNLYLYDTGYVPPAGPAEDGWFTVCKPFQLVGPVPQPPSPVPPIPPTPPTPPPDEDYRVTMNGDIRVTTTGDTRILL